MDQISLEDLALKDFLNRIDQGIELLHGEDAIRLRMVESGLISDDADGLRLTTAGLAMCKIFAVPRVRGQGSQESAAGARNH